MSQGAIFQRVGLACLGMLAMSCSSFSATIVKAQDNDAAVGGGSNAGGSSSTVALSDSAGSSTTGGATSSGGNSSTIDTNVMGGASSIEGTATSGGAPAAGGSAPTGGTSSMVGTAFCTIDAVIYANGAPNPANSCQACQTAVSTTIWVALSEGAKCDSAKVCHAGNCQSGCGIESQYYAAGASKPNWACMTCQPTASTSAWTPDETNCGCTGDFETVDSSTGLCVAKMATIPATSDHSEFSIDMTEVTQDQYDGWLSTNPKLPTSTDANCSWNTTYAEQGVGFTGTDAAHHPVVYVDWCDAYAYCSSVGKRLCGAMAGGSNAFENYNDPTTSQWDSACSSGGGYVYPYGNTYQPTYCDGYDFSTTTHETVVVGSLPNCVTLTGGFGVYDLIGDVSEWEDSCDTTGQFANCRVRGCSINCDPRSLYVGCGLSDYFGRNVVRNDVGFRCCSK